MTWKTNIPLIAILRGIKPNEVLAHISVLIEEGFEAIEIPINSPNWQHSVELAVQNFGDKVLIGAGTVLKTEEVVKLASLNCKLIVTPNTNANVIKKAIDNCMELCIGCATATEAFMAIESGAQNLKIFPSAYFGPKYIKALKAVLPQDISLFAVGGVTPNNLHEYISNGCIGAGLGSELYKAGQSVETTKRKAFEFICAYKNYNKSNHSLRDG